MGWFNLVARFRGEDKLTELAETLAARSFDHVWPCVQQQVATLGVNETRGYLRARATHTIQQQIVELGREGVVIKAALIDRIVQTTLDMLQVQVSARVTAQRTSKVGVRRAA